MAVYQYTARDTMGNELSGTYANVGSVPVLREELTKLGYVLLHAHRQPEAGKLAKRVRQRDVASFAYKFASMYSAGLALTRCLETCEAQVGNHALTHVLADVRRRVELGSSLKQAFEPHRNVFGDFFLGMIEAGESAGQLPKALDMSARYLEKRLEVRQKTRMAFVYPAVVGVVCCLVVLCLLVFVVPTFSQLYGRLHMDLPAPTRVLVTLSLLLRRWWWALILAGTGLTLGARRLAGGACIRTLWDRLTLHVPVLGPLNRLIVVSHFIRTFGILMSVGIPIIDALDIAGEVAHHAEISRITAQLQKATRSGQPVSQSLSPHDIFPPVIVQLVLSGEEAGILPEMLEKGADLLDRDIDRMTTSLLMKLEPTLTVIMGLIIGLILMGVYLPMFDYMAKISS